MNKSKSLNLDDLECKIFEALFNDESLNSYYMKYFVILTFVLVFFVPQAFAESSFNGYSSIDPPLSEVVSGQSTVMNVRFLYTSGPYAMNNFAPIIDVNPFTAGKFVQIDVDSIEITQGQIKRIPITLTVDPQINTAKIFLSISFAGHHFMSGELQKSSWNDQIILDVVNEKPIPEPDYENNVTYERCGPGTTLQNGVCVVNNSQKTISTSSEKWPNPYQQINKISGSVMGVSDNVISSEQTLFVNGTFDQYFGNFNANVFKDYPNSRELVSTMTHTTNELGEFMFNFTIPQFWNLGNYHIVLENGLEEMDWSFAVRKNHSGATLDRTVYPVPWERGPPLKQFKDGFAIDEIYCKDDLVLLPKYDDTPACVTEQTKQKLIERGWTKRVLPEIDLHSKERIAREVGYIGLLMMVPHIGQNQTVAVSLEGRSNIVMQMVDYYDIDVMHTKEAIDGSFLSLFGNMTKPNLEKFFEVPMNAFAKRGILMMSLGGYADERGTHGPFNDFLTENEALKIGRVLEYYESKRASNEDTNWKKIIQWPTGKIIDRHYLEFVEHISDDDIFEYQQIPQNDMYCWTQWWIEPTNMDEDALMTSIQETIARFGSHVDISDREISVYHYEKHIVISVAGSWTKDKAQHQELTDTIKGFIGNSKIDKDDLILCT